MAAYIGSISFLSPLATQVVAPDDLDAATQALSRSPVIDYEAFSMDEVRLIGQYRLAISAAGGYETVWPSIVRGLPEAWVYAVHEAAEVQAFADLGVNPFDPNQFVVYLEEAHVRATLAELSFLKTWAQQSDMEAPNLPSS